jgi:hypothetical protein
MKFAHLINSTGGAAADVNPRTTPATVPSSSVFRNDAHFVAVALEGTAGQTGTVQLWGLDDVDEQKPAAERKWYQVGNAFDVDVGQIVGPSGPIGSGGSAVTVRVPCPRGNVYLQVTTRPAANAVFKLLTLPN